MTSVRLLSARWRLARQARCASRHPHVALACGWQPQAARACVLKLLHAPIEVTSIWRGSFTLDRHSTSYTQSACDSGRMVAHGNRVWKMRRCSFRFGASDSYQYSSRRGCPQKRHRGCGSGHSVPWARDFTTPASHSFWFRDATAQLDATTMASSVGGGYEAMPRSWFHGVRLRRPKRCRRPQRRRRRPSHPQQYVHRWARLLHDNQ
mmetsp:Transcript_47862/g.147642  ORF Transcript_47862/g.147642 Transcript_47862/m.147642 type:complete len:207 (-) Transcript_47862:22-642(-)